MLGFDAIGSAPIAGESVSAAALSANAFAQASLIADLTTSIAMSTSVSAASEATASLTTAITLAAQAAGSAYATGSLSTDISLACDAKASATAQADLTTSPGSVISISESRICDVKAETYIIDGSGRLVYEKTPAAVLDYTWDLTDYLDGIDDSLSSTSITVDANSGISLQSSSVNGSLVTAWIGGGMAGTLGSATLRFVTAAGRLDERTIYFRLRQR